MSHVTQSLPCPQKTNPPVKVKLHRKQGRPSKDTNSLEFQAQQTWGICCVGGSMKPLWDARTKKNHGLTSRTCQSIKSVIPYLRCKEYRMMGSPQPKCRRGPMHSRRSEPYNISRSQDLVKEEAQEAEHLRMCQAEKKKMSESRKRFNKWRTEKTYLVLSNCGIWTTLPGIWVHDDDKDGSGRGIVNLHL